MSSITRKHRRQTAIRCAKQGIPTAKAVAESAAHEIHLARMAASEVMETLLQAIGVVVMQDYGKLNKKADRLEVLAKCLHERSIQVKKNKLSEAEMQASNDFAVAVAMVWAKEEEGEADG